VIALTQLLRELDVVDLADRVVVVVTRNATRLVLVLEFSWIEANT
jgi:hypothetical protein